MSDRASLEAVLRREAPAVWRCLSPLGRDAVFPKGITWQGEQARGAAVNATIGQTTDGAGRPLALPFLADAVADLDAVTSFLYGPVEGPRPLREAWLRRERRLADSAAPTGLSLATHGLTNALATVASLFADPETDVLVPDPCWDSYELILTLHSGARVVPYATHVDGRFSMVPLEAALASVRRKAVLVLNHPGNPSGYAPSLDEAEQIAAIVLAHPHPLVAVTDDAYQGWIYEPGRMRRSLFWDLAERCDPERLVPIKVDGPTKEFVFFAARVGFLTPGVPSGAVDALESKVKTVLRATVGCPSGPSLALVSRALARPDLEDAFAARVSELGRRYRALRTGLERLGERVRVSEFNAAYFALLDLRGRDAEAIRQHLLTTQSLGTVAYPRHGALRVAFCSIAEAAIPDLVARLDAGLRG
jgi:aspartate/methionine/tyrosine aminotransferase